jgi:5-methyltetrahydropteroyltriglutamate--homocysteine methyltransferase
LIKCSKGIRPIEEDIKEVEYWGKILGIENYIKLSTLLHEPDSTQKRKEVEEWAVLYALRFLESTGLNIVYDGEMLRREMYEHPISKIKGFKFLGRVQSFDNRYYNIASVVGEVKRIRPIYVQEFRLIKNIARKELKVPITGAYTLADWTLNDYYLKKYFTTSSSIKEAKYKAKKELVLELIEKVLKPEIRELLDCGATWIQVDEPAATTHPDKKEMELFIESFNMLTDGFVAKFSLHNCYSNYKVLAKYAPSLENCYQLTLEFANRDSLNLGVRDIDRIGYNDLKLFIQNGYTGNFGIGVLNVLDYEGNATKWADLQQKTLIESPLLIKDRLAYASKIIGDSSKISANPDCGLRTRKDWKIIKQKLCNMVQAAEEDSVF